MGLRRRSSFETQGVTVFVTTTVMNFDRVFGLGESYYRILLDSLKFVLQEHKAVLYAYVFMPSHLHLVLRMPEGERLTDLMRDFKKFTSTKIRQQLERDNQVDWIELLRRNSKGKRGQVFKLWMDRFDDVVVYTEDVMRTKVEYIHQNPVKAGLVDKAEDWQFSSARNYLTGDHSLIRVGVGW
ncbi:MAG TPA: transposase [Bacteroidota bacterium]|nr:transposase [Bacteroidota bacterium]